MAAKPLPRTARAGTDCAATAPTRPPLPARPLQRSLRPAPTPPAICGPPPSPSIRCCWTADATSGVAEGIADHTIPSTAGTAAERTWQSLGDQASTAYRAVYQLLDKAPDLSRWAIDMAADRLAPEPEPLIRWQDDAPAAAVHLAFAPHVTPEERAALRQALLLALRIAL